MTYQQKMQAAHHWDVLAADVADQVRAALVADVEEADALPAVYIESKDGVFGQAFRKMLMAHLFDDGVKVIADVTEDACLVDVNSQVITHRQRRHQRPHFGAFALIATGIRVARNVATKDVLIPGGVAADLMVDTGTTLSHREVLIATTVMKDGRYLLSKADLYYINDLDGDHYVEPTSTHKLEVVGE